MTVDDLQRWLARFAQTRIAVVGDFFLDRYLVIDPTLAEPSIETDLMANQVVEIRNSPGAAGTVVNNLVALRVGSVHAVSVIGEDAYGYQLKKELHRLGVHPQGLIESESRFTPTYTKPVLAEAGGHREIERLDIVNRTPTPMDIEDQILHAIDSMASQVDAVILLDQVVAPDVGVLTRRVRSELGAIVSKHPRSVFYADSRAHIEEFGGMIVKANVAEALAAVRRLGHSTVDDAATAGKLLYERNGQPVFVTCGAAGILVTTEHGQTMMPGVPIRGAVDVTGAGDSATAGIVLSLCAGATPEQAAVVGNLVASITVQQLRTTGTASPEHLLQRFQSWNESTG